MVTREQWLDLAEKCANATGPDCEISADICILANWIGPLLPHHTFQGPAINIRRGEGWDPLFDVDWLDWEDEAGESWSGPVPHLTESIDDITALIKQELPGWMVRVQWCGVSAEAWVAPDLNDGRCPQIYRDNAEIWHDYSERNEVEIRPGSREAAIRALCAAFCCAMADKSTT